MPSTSGVPVDRSVDGRPSDAEQVAKERRCCARRRGAAGQIEENVKQPVWLTESGRQVREQHPPPVACATSRYGTAERHGCF